MSLKTYIRIVPQVRNFLNCQHSSLTRAPLCQIKNTCKTSFSLLTKFDLRLYSTDTKSKVKVKHIYYGPLTPQIKAVKLFSLSSSIVGVIAQPFLYTEIARTGNVAIIAAAYTFIGFFTVVTPILLHFITKKYVTHLEYKEDTGSYIARTVNFFCLSKTIEFTPEEVTVPDVPGMFTTIHAKGTPLFLDPRLFEYPEHYAKIMGFDKPLDFKLYQTPPEGDQVKKD